MPGVLQMDSPVCIRDFNLWYNAFEVNGKL